MNCAACNNEIDITGKVHFRDECPKCGADLHTCKNCDFFDPSAYRQCRETGPDNVSEKERANYCDYFRPALSRQGAPDKGQDAKSQLDALFKK